jgi:hypothetical protein
VGVSGQGDGAAAGVLGTGGVTGVGVTGQGGSTSGAGVVGTGGPNSAGVIGNGTGTGAGVSGHGDPSGTGPGVYAFVGTGDGLYTNGAVHVDANIGSGTPTANRLYGDSIVKAWGQVHSDGTGGASIVAGMNIASVSVSAGAFQVTLATGMSSIHYAVVPASQNGWTLWPEIPFTKTTFAIFNGSSQDPASVAQDVFFVVLGAQ